MNYKVCLFQIQQKCLDLPNGLNNQHQTSRANSVWGALHEHHGLRSLHSSQLLVDMSLQLLLPSNSPFHCRRTRNHRGIWFTSSRLSQWTLWDCNIIQNINSQIAKKTDFEKSIPSVSSIEAQNWLHFPNALSELAEYFLGSPSWCITTALLILFWLNNPMQFLTKYSKVKWWTTKFACFKFNKNA